MSHELYRHYDEAGRLLYVGISCSALARLASHKKKSEWFSSVATVRIQKCRDRQDAMIAEIMAIRDEKPEFNKLCGKLPCEKNPKTPRVIKPKMTPEQARVIKLAKRQFRLSVLRQMAAVDMPKIFERNPHRALVAVINRQTRRLERMSQFS